MNWPFNHIGRHLTHGKTSPCYDIIRNSYTHFIEGNRVFNLVACSYKFQENIRLYIRE